MKKTLKNILSLLFILTVLFGCESSKKPKTDLQKENLKGDVVFVLKDNGNSCDIYDSLGMRKQHIIAVLNQIYHRENYFYSDRKLSKKIVYGMIANYDSDTDTTTYVYDLNSNLISSQNKSMIVNYSYDSKGRLVKETYNFSDSSFMSIEKKYYYSNNNILDSMLFFSDYHTDTLYLTNTVYKNGINTDILSYDIIKSKNQRFLTASENMKYNENGDLIELTETDYKSIHDNPIVTITKFEYGYDSYKNWIQKNIHGNNEKDSIETRVIIYKGEDYSSYLNNFDNVLSSLNKNSNTNSDKVSNQINQTNNSTNTYQQPSEQRQKQWVNCSKCHGQGILKCEVCNGSGLINCHFCKGSGWISYGNQEHSCSSCNRTGKSRCGSCYGKGNKGNCSTCGGRGQVQL